MEKVKEILAWYVVHVSGCRKLGMEGDIARSKLDRDGGKRAQEALDILLGRENSS